MRIREWWGRVCFRVVRSGRPTGSTASARSLTSARSSGSPWARSAGCHCWLSKRLPASSQTPPARTAPAGPADARCQHTTPRRRPASTTHAPTPCPDHETAPAHRCGPQQPTKPPPAPNDQRNAPERTNPHGPRPDRRRPSPSHRACCRACIPEMPLPVEPVVQHTSSHTRGASPRTRTPERPTPMNDQG